MSTRRQPGRVAAFEAARRDLAALAYRMLGDMGRAEDIVQEAWLRWEGHAGEAENPKAYLVTIVTRLCLNELQSARARREELRADRLPEPVDLEERDLSGVERLEQISMAFLVVLQRLKPAERAVLILHDVLDFEHQQIAALIDRSAPTCRKLLERARAHLDGARHMFFPNPEEHHRLLQAFLGAVSEGNVTALVELLAEDAVMITDGGPGGREAGGLRNLPRPLMGAARIAAFVLATAGRNSGALQLERRELNGQPAIVFWQDERPFAALLLAVKDGKIQRVFFHADPARLRFLRRRVETTTLSAPH
ncbi:sigma-70 family RNA polymerase sigma factor [Anaeromyxobacter oryzae]|nr:sigma-70 family RNA polymerase sigma factor [Anaeromyxobacter oryzae]